jgi:hypothetical protein
MRLCPRCGKEAPESDTWTFSRTDGATEVCPMCGIGEGLDAMEGEMVPRGAWPIGRY